MHWSSNTSADNSHDKAAGSDFRVISVNAFEGNTVDRGEHQSHEIRSPMNAILGFSEILERQMKDGNYVSSIISLARSLLRLIHDILDLSKVEASKLELEMSAVDCRLYLLSSIIFLSSV